MRTSKMKATLVAMTCVLAMSAGTAYAGNYVRYETYVSYSASGGGYAAGVVSAARSSSDASQYIGCQVYVNSSGSQYGTCYANTASGDSLSCSSSVAALVDQMRAISDNSYVNFYANSSGYCTSVVVHNSSRYTAGSSSSSGLVVAP